MDMLSKQEHNLEIIDKNIKKQERERLLQNERKKLIEDAKVKTVTNNRNTT